MLCNLRLQSASDSSTIGEGRPRPTANGIQGAKRIKVEDDAAKASVPLRYISYSTLNDQFMYRPRWIGHRRLLRLPATEQAVPPRAQDVQQLLARRLLALAPLGGQVDLAMTTS